jgi:hypothetical protein
MDCSQVRQEGDQRGSKCSWHNDCGRAIQQVATANERLPLTKDYMHYFQFEIKEWKPELANTQAFTKWAMKHQDVLF